MTKSIITVILVIIFSPLCKGQVTLSQLDTLPKNVFYNDEFKWKMIIPDGFIKQSAAAFAAQQKHGTEMVGKGLNTEIDDRAQQICSFKYGQYGYFEVNKHTFSKKMYGDFLASCYQIENEFYTSLKNQVASTFKIDTLHSTKTINGLAFQYFQMEVAGNNKVLVHMLVYIKLFDNKYFTVLMVYPDDASGDVMLTAWKNSKFDRN
ncbi:hypothetical protein [Mucilaginibacter sp.]|uniref:hypothetical protein n=1 Tax=Mucilaginibacter sp. TaxID=1882438 RepID=UPI00283FA53C|nr:hypothetical protein [Mucilaginibacter sp.]MDR3697075.1 hypothetical protein [Mucilaginibacter sp.]